MQAAIVILHTASLIATLILITAVTPSATPAERAIPLKRLRFTDPRMQHVIAAGRASSPLFRALVERLEQTDVVVYVECAVLRPRLDGELTFVGAAAGIRYVLVRIAWDLPAPRKIAILGHELQHALEVAASPDIVSAETMAVAYQRFGFTKTQRFDRVDFDTAAAVDAGITIWREIAGRADGD